MKKSLKIFLRFLAVIITVFSFPALLNMNALLYGESNPEILKPQVVTVPLSPQQVTVSGLIGEALTASENGRLKTLPYWENGRLIKIFSQDSTAENSNNSFAHAGTDWRGEHAGKWMIATSRAVIRTHDQELQKLLFQTADYLLSQQGPDGYLGTYVPSMRLNSKTRTNFDRTWDIWNNSYGILGFLEIYKYWPEAKYLEAAKKIGDLLYRTFYKTDKSAAYQGNHVGLSGTILLEPIVELYQVTADPKYLDFAEEIIKQIEDRPGLQIVSRALQGLDVADIGDGKIYQLNWNLVGIAKLYEMTGNPDYLKVVTNAYESIARDHLTLGSAPWGGIGLHHEIYNLKGFWSPYGWVETCNTMSWIHLSRELFRITGEAKYAEMIEQAAFNSLLGAQYPDGENWCYFTFPIGCRHLSIYRDCCRSSGMVALEDLPPLIFSTRLQGVSVNIYTPATAELELPNTGKIKIVQETDYPFDGKVNIRMECTRSREFQLSLRIPSWADGAKIVVNDKAISEKILPGTFLDLTRKWGKENHIEILFPIRIKNHYSSEQAAHRGTEIYRIDWLAFTRGPLVYATNGLIYDKEREERFSIPRSMADSILTECQAPAGYHGPAYQLNLPDKEPVLFLPYYEAGGRQNGTWRLTWIQVDRK